MESDSVWSSAGILVGEPEGLVARGLGAVHQLVRHVAVGPQIKLKPQLATRFVGDTLHRLNGVRVNQINPGWVLTENEAQRKRDNGLSDNWPSELPPVYAPSGRILKPEEIAEAAVYWLSDAAGPVSGCVVELEQYPAMGRNPDKV